MAWLIGSKYVNPLFLPSPKSVFETAVILIVNGELAKALWASFIRINIAVIFSVALSISLGLLAANYKFWDGFITPVASFLRYIPPTVFYPLLMMFLGIEETMKITFLFMAMFVYFLPSVVICLKDVPHGYIEAGRATGMTKFQVIKSIQFPIALPIISKSFIMMYGIGWTYVVIAEIVNARYGIGHLINISTSRGRTDIVYVSILAIILISFIVDNLGNDSIKKIFKWKYLEDKSEKI